MFYVACKGGLLSKDKTVQHEAYTVSPVVSDALSFTTRDEAEAAGSYIVGPSDEPYLVIELNIGL